MAINKNAARKNILDRLTGFTRFHPVSTDLFTDWTVEPGDVIKVENDGVEYDVPIYQMDIDWKGTPTIDIQSTGSKKRPDPSKLSKGSGYGGSRKKEEDEMMLVTHHTEIIKNNDEIVAMAYETGLLPGVKQFFNPLNSYKVGDYVLYGVNPIVTYRFTTAHVAGTPWDINEVEAVKTQEGRITVTEDRITAEVSRALSAESSLSSSLDLKADSATLSTVMDVNGNVTAASIATAINTTSGQSIVTLTADHIEMSGSVIASRLSGEDVSFGDCAVSGTLTGALTGNVEGNLDGSVIGEGHEGYFENGVFVGSSFASVADGVAAVQIVETSAGSGTYRLQYKHYGDTSWTNDSTTFSRAATQPTIGGSWSGGVYTITSDVTPASGSVMTTTLWTDISPGQPTVSGNTVSVTYDIGWQEYYEGQMIRGGSTGRTGTIPIDMSLGTRSSTQPSGKTQLWSTLTTNGYYPVASNGYIRVNVSTSHSISTSVKSGTYATRADMEAAYPNHSWSSLGSVSTGYRAVEITCGSTSKWCFYVGT